MSSEHPFSSSSSSYASQSYSEELVAPAKPEVTLLGPGPLTSWEMDEKDEATFWEHTKKTFGYGSFADTEGVLHRNRGVRAQKTSGAVGLFRATVNLLKDVTGLPATSKVVFIEGGHNAANAGHANLFATEPEVPVVAICNGGFSGDVWGKDLKDYEAKGALDKVILVTVPDGQSATAEQVQAALLANGVAHGTPFNITFTSSETSTSVMMPKQNMVDILNIPGRRRALIDASSGLMAQEIPGIHGVGENGLTKDGLTRGVTVFATGQKALRLPTDYCAIVFCAEDLEALSPENQAKARIPMPKAVRIEKPELDAVAIKRSSRVRGCLEAYYGLSQMKLMQQRGQDHIQNAERTSQYVKDAVAEHPAFDFFAKDPKDRGNYNMVIVSRNAFLNSLPATERQAVMAEAHELLADEGFAIDVKPYGTRGDFRFTTLDIQSKEQAKITLDAFDYAVNKAIVKMQSKSITLVAEDQFLYANPAEVEAAIAAKTSELAAKGITFIDARDHEIDYTALPIGNYVIYKPQLLGEQITAEYAKIKQASLQKTAIIVAAKTVPATAKFDIFVREGAGVNNLPLEQAAADGHLVLNCPGVNSKVTSNNTINAVAGHSHITNFVAKGMSSEASALNLQPLYGPSPEVDKPALNEKVRGKTVAVLGAGDIGTQTILGLLESEAEVVKVYSRSLQEFGTAQMKLLTERDPKFAKLVICDSIDEAMAGSNIAINHLALTDDTKDAIGKETIDRMAYGAEIIDASRPGIINHEALIAAHQSGQISRIVVDFDTPDKAQNNEAIAKLFARAKTNPTFEYSPHAFADTCPITRGEMLDTALEQVALARNGKARNFAGLGEAPTGYGNIGKKKPEGIAPLSEVIKSTLGAKINPETFVERTAAACSNGRT